MEVAMHGLINAFTELTTNLNSNVIVLPTVSSVLKGLQLAIAEIEQELGEGSIRSGAVCLESRTVESGGDQASAETVDCCGYVLAGSGGPGQVAEFG